MPNVPTTLMRLANPRLRALLDSSLVHSVAGARLVDGDLLFVANNQSKDTHYNGTMAVRLSSQGELRWASTLEAPGRTEQEPKMPQPWGWHVTGDRNRILPTPDRGALVVGRAYVADTPAAAKLDEAGKIEWSRVAELGFEGNSRYPPVWFVGSQHVAVLMRETSAHSGSAPGIPPYGFASFDARTGSKLASAGIGERHGSGDVATFMPDGRILYAEAWGSGLSLTTFDAHGRGLEHREIPEMWSELAESDRGPSLSAPALVLGDGGVILVGGCHFIRLDSSLHLTAHHVGRTAEEVFESVYPRETPAGYLIGETSPWGGSCVRWSADGSLHEELGGWELDRDHVLDCWIDADGTQLRGLTLQGEILVLPLGQDSENPVSSLAPRLVHARPEEGVVTVPLGTGPARPLPISAPGGERPLEGRDYDRATALELGRLLSETSSGAWRSTETDHCAMPAYLTDDDHVIAIVGTGAKPVHGALKHLLDVDTRARRLAWTALDSSIVVAGQREVVSAWSLVNQPGEGLSLCAQLAAPTVEVSFLDLGLQAAGGFTVPVGSLYDVARPVLVTPDGSAVLALNDRTSSDVRLERWRPDGSLQWRSDYAARGPVLSLALRGDGGVALAGPDGFWVAGVDDGAFVGERRVRLVGAEICQWTLAPDGVVIAEREKLVRHPLLGESMTIPLALELLGQRHFYWVRERDLPPPRMVALADGGIVLSDFAFTRHEVNAAHCYDETYVARLRRLDPQGRLQWTQTAGKAKTRREWFWHDTASSHDPIGIGRFGIVRTRYEGGTRVDGLAVLPNGVAVATLLGSTTGLWAVGPDGREAWLRQEEDIWRTRPNLPIGLPDGGFVIASKGPRLGLFDANGKKRGETGESEGAELYAGVTPIRGDRIALVRVRE